MKKVLVVLFAFLFFTINQAFAYRITDFSSDTKIIAAMQMLEQAGEQDVFRNLQRSGIRVKFADLSKYAYNSHKCYAVNTYNEFGSRVILINVMYKNAPTEQIACLIAHESQHHTFTNSKQEELRAWISETQAWNELVKRNRTLLTSSEPLAKRENYIARIRTKSGVVGIQKIIASNPVYAGLD